MISLAIPRNGKRNAMCNISQTVAMTIISLWPWTLGLHCQAQVHKAAPIVASAKAFDPTVERLPAHFEGLSISNLWQALARPDLRKSEYETQSEYDSRIANLGTSRLIGNVPLNGLIAIVIPCDYPEPGLQCDQYDAEHQRMSIESPIDENDFLVEEDASPRRPGGIAQNGFGARFSISKQNMTRYFVSATVPSWYTAQTTEPSRPQINRRVEITIVPEEAQRARGNVKELLIGHVTAPFIVSSEHSVEAAKPSWPIETNMILHTFHMEITDVWFFNSVTGTVYRKLSEVGQ
jgi:hypothetical protein